MACPFQQCLHARRSALPLLPAGLPLPSSTPFLHSLPPLPPGIPPPLPCLPAARQGEQRGPGPRVTAGHTHPGGTAWGGGGLLLPRPVRLPTCTCLFAAQCLGSVHSGTVGDSNGRHKALLGPPPTRTRPCSQHPHVHPSPRRTHPSDRGHKMMAEALAGPLLRAAAQESAAAAGLWALRRRDVLRLRGLPPPMIPGNTESPTTLCAMQVQQRRRCCCCCCCSCCGVQLWGAAGAQGSRHAVLCAS